MDTYDDNWVSHPIHKIKILDILQLSETFSLDI